jgi:hypothetical protein
MAPRAAVLVLAAAVLAGCASTVDSLPEKLGGLPATAPPRPAEQPAYPNVYAIDAPREVKPLTAPEQRKLETDLLAARESQKERLNPTPPPRRGPAATKGGAPKPARKPPPGKAAETKK